MICHTWYDLLTYGACMVGIVEVMIVVLCQTECDHAMIVDGVET
jgi:hypothetical protein